LGVTPPSSSTIIVFFDETIQRVGLLSPEMSEELRRFGEPRISSLEAASLLRKSIKDGPMSVWALSTEGCVVEVIASALERERLVPLYVCEHADFAFGSKAESFSILGKKVRTRNLKCLWISNVSTDRIGKRECALAASGCKGKGATTTFRRRPRRRLPACQRR
jgi:hypothetical protein